MDVLKTFKPRKLIELTEKETISSFASLKQNLEFHLTSCNSFAPFLAPNFEWKLANVPNRGLQDDGAGADSKTAAQKSIVLEHMIGLIVGFCPEFIRLEIQRKCTSLNWIWKRIRRHYGFNKSEGNFLNLSTIKYQKGERYEAFFQRIMAHLYDNLMCPESTLIFDGEVFTQSEEMSPSTERLAVFLWLYYIDERLPMYVSRVYSHDLQKMSLKDLQPILSQNMNSLLIELAVQEDIKLNYSNSSKRGNGQTAYDQSQYKSNTIRSSSSSKTCAFCKACNKPYIGHGVNDCWTLSPFSKSDIVNTLANNSEDNKNVLLDNADFSSADHSPPYANISRVEVMKSPSFVCSYKGYPCKVTLDSGATSNCISLNLVQAPGIPLVRTTKGATQLDGSQVQTCGEVDCILKFGSEKLRLVALVIHSTDADILGGMPFFRRNNIELSMSKEEIYIRNTVVKYGQGPDPTGSSFFKAESFIVETPASTVRLSEKAVDLPCFEHVCNGVGNDSVFISQV